MSTTYSVPDSDIPELFSFRRSFGVAEKFFSQLSQIPGNVGDFQERYGTFEDTGAVEQFTRAVQDAKEIAARLGNPDTLKAQLAKDGQYLQRPDPPDELYARLVWIAMQVSGVADTFRQTLLALDGLLHAGVSAGERAQSLKRILAGPTGLIALASETEAKTRSARDDLGAIVPRFSTVVQVFHQTQVLNLANQDIGGLQSKIQRLNRQLDEAKQKGHGWLSGLRGKSDDGEVTRLTEEIKTSQFELGKKQRLVDDMAYFFTTVDGVIPALMEVGENLRKMGLLFSDAGDKLGLAVNISSPDQLSNYEWLAKALQFPSAIARWESVKTAADSAVQGSMASFN